MSENNANKNSMDNSIRQSINWHSQCDDQIHYYKHEHENIKLMNHKSHCLLYNKSLSMP
jgi:hypothetical protein